MKEKRKGKSGCLKVKPLHARISCLLKELFWCVKASTSCIAKKKREKKWASADETLFLYDVVQHPWRREHSFFVTLRFRVSVCACATNGAKRTILLFQSTMRSFFFLDHRSRNATWKAADVKIKERKTHTTVTVVDFKENNNNN